MTRASELGDCGWCQSAESVYRGRCRICDTVVVEKTRPLVASTGAESAPENATGERTSGARPRPRPGWVA